jgi:hypothetical protein
MLPPPLCPQKKNLAGHGPSPKPIEPLGHAFSWPSKPSTEFVAVKTLNRGKIFFLNFILGNPHRRTLCKRFTVHLVSGVDAAEMRPLATSKHAEPSANFLAYRIQLCKTPRAVKRLITAPSSARRS